LTPEERRESFAHRPVAHRAAIVAAGPVFNLVLAYLIFTGGLAIGVPMFVPEFESITPVVDAVAPDSPAAAAGLQKGDRITAIDGKQITTWTEMTTIVRASAGKPLTLEVERGGRSLRVEITPVAKEAELETGEKTMVGQIGIQKDSRGSPIEADNPIEAVYKGVEATWKWTELTAVGIFKLLTGQLSKDNIGGPLLIAQMSGSAASEGVLSVAMFIAILSINLGIINFLPIPVLDGGHLFFFGIEAILGRPLSMRKREIAQQVGLFLLIALMLLATYNDIVRWLQPG
jgi:regulator of sigma E protease